MKPFSSKTTLIAIMSFNRGEYLNNCVDSAAKYFTDYPLTIFDDCSTHPPTQQLLDQLRGRYEIVNCRAVAKGDRGGLHANMNHALDHAATLGMEYVLLIQDDMQFIRPIDGDFETQINECFASQPDIGQVDPTFFRGYWPDETLHARVHICKSPPSYVPMPLAGWHQGLVDVGVVSLTRLKSVGFQFADSEQDSIRRAHSLNLRRVHPRDSIMAQTPWPSVTEKRRNGKRTFRDTLRGPLIGLQEWAMKTGCHPILPWSPEKISAFKARPIEHYPVADRYLEIEASLHSPWWFISCHDISDFTNPLRALSLRWLTAGPPDYRRNAESKLRSDGIDWKCHAGELRRRHSSPDSSQEQ